ncbi:hypothetical protein DKX38_027692 [Salix brachista]|uniref:Reverse transcriptase Ty1/copia-type domain-containing protein n=1 Tax=Salix brachista TaxID=2182728 RepID=A0A5N5J5T0_9ROSI|nr:hypothetical protein DKX38_027692 [Salix brachista]
MLHAKNVPGRWWAKAMKTATFVINKLPQQRLNFQSPFEKLWNKKPTSLPDSEGFKEEMQIARIQLSKDEDDTNSQEEVIDDDAEIKENPWQTGIHDQLNEEFNATTTSNPPRRSTRMKKPNAKYANAAVVEGDVCMLVMNGLKATQLIRSFEETGNWDALLRLE